MAGPDIPFDKAYLTATWLETLLYGMNFVLYWTCMSMLTRCRRTPKVNTVMVGSRTLMFAFSTAHVSLGFQRLVEGCNILRDRPGGPAAFFSDVSVPPNVVKVGIHTVNASPLRSYAFFIGDSIVVWRCWLVWGRDWKMCVLPTLLIIASASAVPGYPIAVMSSSSYFSPSLAVCGFAQTVKCARAPMVDSPFAHSLQTWNGLVFGLSLATNVTVTLLISLRLCYLLRVEGGSRTFRFWRVLVIIIESGMIYSVALVCEITLYFLRSNAFYIVYDPIAQLTAIAPTLIIVLTALQLTSSDVRAFKPCGGVMTESIEPLRFSPDNAHLGGAPPVGGLLKHRVERSDINDLSLATEEGEMSSAQACHQCNMSRFHWYFDELPVSQTVIGPAGICNRGTLPMMDIPTRPICRRSLGSRRT
ncbi:hypothetical protein BD414DRAFT_531010 [Trametes punicea]|nr:hypothetical protein BD414DRAFT_531010 [Trametes punicea]